MKKGGTTEKSLQPKVATKSLSAIKFNLSDHNLACFKGNDKTPSNKLKGQTSKEFKWLSHTKPINLVKVGEERLPLQRTRAISCSSSFNEQVVIMQYDNIDVYIDNSTRKKSSSSSSKESGKNGKKSEPEDGTQDQFLQSCVRVITEQTDNTSNTATLGLGLTPPNLTPRSLEFEPCYDLYNNFYQTRNKPVRNRQSVTIEESRRFIIEYDNIENDERTTVMVKNIPNKYTQEMLLQQFTVNYENKFDFFYLPIDKDVHFMLFQNDCNVGYAFVNFINTTFLKEFYQEFHFKRWKKYKSSKICNIFYARYQGTLQLADHFKHTKIMNQKDRKIKPLIGISEANRIKDLKEIIKNQRNQD